MRTTRGAAAVAIAAAIAAALPATAAHQPDTYAPHIHQGYPPRPHGAAAIRATFGPPCSADARASHIHLRATDDNRLYRVNFHRRLGEGLSSTNLSWDVPIHLRTTGYDATLLRGIYGYACRAIADTTTWSTHAWGIAVDVNSAYEPVGSTDCNTVWTHMAAIWQGHGWYWGKAFGDCMHFQYATGT